MWQTIIDWCANAIETLAGWFLDFLYYAGGWIFVEIWNDLTGQHSTLLQRLSGIVPTFDFDFSFITGPMWVLVNEWIPVSYCFSCLGIYVSIAVAVYTVNWILGAIPTVS